MKANKNNINNSKPIDAAMWISWLYNNTVISNLHLRTLVVTSCLFVKGCGFNLHTLLL